MGLFLLGQPHHDFMIPDLADGQASRFATILLYLNEPEMGGETSFPQWLNGKNRNILEVVPEMGKAVLFYNQLPDGNYDVRSLHAAKP
jgi:prolyl 4-hydroxylase